MTGEFLEGCIEDVFLWKIVIIQKKDLPAVGRLKDRLTGLPAAG
jgi:hypothetical protein